MSKNMIQKQPPEVFYKKYVAKNFAQLTEEHLWCNLFFNKVAGLRHATVFKEESTTRVFSCEFFEDFNSIFFHKTRWLLLCDY